MLFNAGLIAAGFTKSNPFLLGHLVQLYNNCADQADPMLIYSMYNLAC